jgi:hypothetical protein
MQLMPSVRLYGGYRLGQRASPAYAFFFSFQEETGMRLAGSRGGNESLVAGRKPAKSRTDALPQVSLEPEGAMAGFELGRLPFEPGGAMAGFETGRLSAEPEGAMAGFESSTVSKLGVAWCRRR